MTAEEWRAIPGFSRYKVSDQGRIWSTVRGRVLKPSENSQNHYMYVGIYGDGSTRQTHHPIHWWVTFAFLGPRKDGQVVRHLDGDRQNNALTNLCYGSQAQNVADTFAHGYRPPTPARGRGCCLHGHPTTKTNTRRLPDGGLVCRVCDREQQAARRHRRRMEIAAAHQDVAA